MTIECYNIMLQGTSICDTMPKNLRFRIPKKPKFRNLREKKRYDNRMLKQRKGKRFTAKVNYYDEINSLDKIRLGYDKKGI